LLAYRLIGLFYPFKNRVKFFKAVLGQLWFFFIFDMLFCGITWGTLYSKRFKSVSEHCQELHPTETSGIPSLDPKELCRFMGLGGKNMALMIIVMWKLAQVGEYT